MTLKLKRSPIMILGEKRVRLNVSGQHPVDKYSSNVDKV